MNFWKKRKGLIAFLLVMAFLYAALSFAKSIFLKQLGKRLNQAFEVSELKLSYLPPTLIVKNMRSRSDNPRFSVDSLRISLSFLSLFRREKPVTVEVDHPVLVYKDKASKSTARKTGLPFDLPFVIDSGYINNGRFSVDINQGTFELERVSAFFSLDSQRLNLLLRSARARVRPYSSTEVLEGELETLITTRGRTVNLNRLVIQGENLAVRVEGKLSSLETTKVDLRAVFNLDTQFIMSAFNLPFDWKGKTSGEATISNSSGNLIIKANYTTKDFSLNQVYLGSVEGQVLVEKERGGRVLAEIKNYQKPVEKVIITFGSGKVEGQMSGFHLDPIMRYVSVPWPVASPAWGNFSLSHGQLEVSAEFRDSVDRGQVKGRHSFNGQVQLSLNIPQKDLRIQTKDLETSFGRINLEGQVVIDKLLDLSVRGQFLDIKAAREFTQKILNINFDFPEIRGAGRASIYIKGDYRRPDLSFDFSCSPAGFERFDVTTARGEVRVEAGRVEGKVYVVDRNIQGEINLKIDGEKSETRISLERGIVESILSSLNLSFPLKGLASGEFLYLIVKDKVTVEGDFAADELFFLGSRIEKVRGKLSWKEEDLSFPELKFNLNGGEVSGRLALGLMDNSYDFDLKATKVELQPFSPSFSGILDIDLRGRGIFGQGRPHGNFSIEKFGLYFLKASGSVGEYSLNFLNNNLSLEIKGKLFPGNSYYEARLEIPLDRDFISGEVRGQLNNLDFLLPWKGANGTVDYLLSFQGPTSSPELSGAIEVKGSLLPIPGFAHALTDFSGLAFFKNRQVSIRSFQGLLGGGPVQGSGELNFGEKGLEKAEVRLEGKNMQLSVFERTRSVADGSLRFLKQGSRTVLEGDFALKEVIWKKEFWEKLSFSSQPYTEENKKRWIDDLNLNLRLRARDNVWMENSLGRIRARLDLTISGTVSNPIITGEIEALSGTVYFQDRDFKVLRGRLSFFNPLVIDPYLDFQGEAYIKDYHVLFSLTGLVSSLKPEFSSSPPLPSEEILALLALGESYQRRYSLDPTQMSTASLISYQLARKSENLFSLDRFRLDPFIMGSTSEITARLTVGKRLSKNFFILYSTNLATQREEIIRLEWELSGGLSLVAIRNEVGRVSFDFKLRRRF
ncbi:MAG: translocation/assembly module TamB domain-containing protein [Candidatus Aminicenantes bacterium]|nr:translocation/assembly module TamB domain-containing protein [Candidatus Aminicenantes bacterium]